MKAKRFLLALNSSNSVLFARDQRVTVLIGILLMFTTLCVKLKSLIG